MKIIDTLIKNLQNLPGVGPRSARRIAVHLLMRRPETLDTLAELFKSVSETISYCTLCGNVGTKSLCDICEDTGRNPFIIAIVENISDLWAIERSKSFNGQYHVLGGVLSAIEGVGPENLRLDRLQNRVDRLLSENPDTQIELILATNLTVEGQTTAHYITKLFTDERVKITKLAHGLPAGGELDYMDDGTIITALKARS